MIVVPEVMAVAVLVIVAVTVAAVGARLGVVTAMPKKVPAAETDALVPVKIALFVIAAGVTAPLELTAETGVALIRVWK